MKNYLLSLLAILLFSAVSAQIIVPIESQNTLELNLCDAALITATSYSGTSFHSLNISLDEGSVYNAIINPGYFSQEWDVVGGSELRVYDGFGETASLIDTYSSISHPSGFLLNLESDSIRIEFITTEESVGNGFELNILCDEALQELPTAKFQPLLTEDWYFDDEQDMYVLRSCLNDSINIAVEPFYLNPQLEDQNIDSMIIKWSLGDRAFKRDTGLTSIDHIYTSGSGYLVTVYSKGISEAESYLKFMVRNSPTPTFTLNENQAFCLDEPTELAGGMNGNQVIGASASMGATSITEFFGTLIYLPDGNDQNYTTAIEVNGFPEGTTVSSASDLAALCFNMEHSYLGDLEMMLTCPNGTNINIFNSYIGDGLFSDGFGGGATFFGDARDPSPDGVPGIGFDYCFSNFAQWGTIGDEYAAGNTVPVLSFGNGGNAMASGTYLPEESFESFIGCPVNGEWVLTVRDNIASDDGFIFDWSLGLSDELSNSGFQNELVSASWETNDWIASVNEGSIEITPQNAEPNDLTFTVTDDNGCSFSNYLTIQIADTLAEITEPVICDLNYELEWPSSIGELSFVSGPSSNVTITNTGDTYAVEVPQAGDYTFEFNYFDCSSAAQANLTFLEDSDPACITGIQEIDFIREFTLAPNPAANFTEVKFELKQAENISITLTTLDGKVISKVRYSLTPGEQNQRVNLENIEAGAYLISIIGERFKSSGLLIKE